MDRRFIIALFILLTMAAGGCSVMSDPTPQGTAPVINITHVRDADIAYRVVGEGPPILLLMGYGGTMESWPTTFVDTLAKEHTVIMMDNRNMGYSLPNATPVSIKGMADDAAGLLSQLKIDRADVLGWSMGGTIAQEFALKYPTMVNRLVLYATLCTPKNVIPRISNLEGSAGEHLFPQHWRDYHQDWQNVLPEVLAPASKESVDRQLDAIKSWGGTCDRLPEIKHPALLISGMEDEITPSDEMTYLANNIPGAWLARYENTGHGLIFQIPTDMGELVNDYLRLKVRAE